MTNDPAQNPYTASQQDGGESLTNLKHIIQGNSRTGMIITFALIQGIVIVSAIMVFMVFSRRQPGDSLLGLDSDSMIWIVLGGGIALVSIIATVVLRAVFRSIAYGEFRGANVDPEVMRETNASVPQAVPKLIGAFQTRTIIGQAILEGAAMINAVLMFVNDNLLHVIPIVVLVVGVGLQVPTPGKIRDWIENAFLHSP
ncbi:M48 family metalloprotease [Stieleria varia]|uniref:Uncharacterized protein n=1 Tax=Stieleria varia TaxID=2528005 RepID=A0A5C6B7E2_9BACT|nr:hypothetical protein [Stieleria varia]TWU07850.1 hypothetical protein Pla52n_04260 [Stieleria varia]